MCVWAGGWEGSGDGCEVKTETAGQALKTF